MCMYIHLGPFLSHLPEVTIPEIMFEIQQLLAHINPNSPAQAEAYNSYMCNRKEYERIAAATAHKYKPSNFLQLAKEAFTERERDPIPNIPTVHVDERNLYRGTKIPLPPEREPPEEPPLPNRNMDPLGNAPCVCSCCAWGSPSSWDSHHEMRFLWGIGG